MTPVACQALLKDIKNVGYTDLDGLAAQPITGFMYLVNLFVFLDFARDDSSRYLKELSDKVGDQRGADNFVVLNPSNVTTRYFFAIPQELGDFLKGPPITLGAFFMGYESSELIGSYKELTIG